MIDVLALAKEQLSRTRLDILVFGPTLDPRSAEPYTAGFQIKREEIKRRLIAEGHDAAFGEDVVGNSLPSHLSDPLLQEKVAMRAADLIIVLVRSPGSVFEAAVITTERELCQKTGFYCFEEQRVEFMGRALQAMTQYGATCDFVSLEDVTICHLTTAVLQRALAVQTGKALLF